MVFTCLFNYLHSLHVLHYSVYSDDDLRSGSKIYSYFQLPYFNRNKHRFNVNLEKKNAFGYFIYKRKGFNILSLLTVKKSNYWNISNFHTCSKFIYMVGYHTCDSVTFIHKILQLIIYGDLSLSYIKTQVYKNLYWCYVIVHSTPS